MLYCKPTDQRGETLIELLVASFILSAILFLILSIFISNRQGIRQSWEGTGESEAAAAVIEHIKANPKDVFQAVDHGVTSLKSQDLDWLLSGAFKDYEVEIELLPYLSYSPTQLIKIVVRAKESGGNTWNEKATLLRNEENP